MPDFVIPAMLVGLGAIGCGVLIGAVAIYRRIAALTNTLVDLHGAVVGSKTDIAQAAQGIQHVHDDLVRLVRDTNKGAEIVRAVTRLPTR